MNDENWNSIDIARLTSAFHARLSRSSDRHGSRFPLFDPAAAAIMIARSGNHEVTISGVPAATAGGPPQASTDDPPGENVLLIDSFTASSASFDPGNGTLVSVGYQRLSLHFSSQD